MTTPRRSAMHMLISKGVGAFGGAFELGRALLADAPEPSEPAPAALPRIASPPPPPPPRGTGDASPRTPPAPPPARCALVGGSFRCLLVHGHAGQCLMEAVT